MYFDTWMLCIMSLCTYTHIHVGMWAYAIDHLLSSPNLLKLNLVLYMGQCMRILSTNPSLTFYPCKLLSLIFKPGVCLVALSKDLHSS